MKVKTDFKKRDLFVVLPLLVIASGMTGYVQEGYGLYEAFLNSMNLITAEFDPLPDNVFIEAARLGGLVFYFGLIFAAVKFIFESGFTFAKTKNKDAVAVHGDSVYAEVLSKALGKNGIKSENKLALKAPKQVILFEKDEDAIDFCQKHYEELSKAKEVHLCLESGNHFTLEHDNVFITNMSEVRAIDYWTKYYSKSSEKIVIVGSGQLAETVLYWGLLTNVFSIECKSEYHQFGDFDKFISTHGDLEKTLREFGSDSISFCKDEWYLKKEEVMSADRIILCGDTAKNIENALDMKFAGVKCPIHLFAENYNIKAFLDETVTIVGTLNEENIKDVLLMDSLHRGGKLSHAAYMVLLEEGQERVDADTIRSYIETPEFLESWKDLDAFTRQSNYAAAIHCPLKAELLMDLGIDVNGLTAEENKRLYEALSDRDKARLQEIEHIRWSRYHLLNNWKKPEKDIVIDGKVKAKDSKNRLHRDLVPYGELSAEEKAKDAFSYETLSLYK